MVNWTSPQELASVVEIFTKLTYCYLGIYVWELFISSTFEWSLFTRQRKLQWSLVFYFLCRYSLLGALVGIVISMSPTTKINCQAVYRFDLWACNTAIAAASTSLMLRTMSLWKKNIVVMVVVGILCLVNWVLLYIGIPAVHATWDATTLGCIVTFTNLTVLKVDYLYSMFFNFVILFLTAVALLRQDSFSGLRELVFRQGLVHYVVAFLASIAPAVLAVLNLNVPMDFISVLPFAMICTIAACRAVSHINDGSGDRYVHSSTVQGSRTKTRFGVATKANAGRFTIARPPQVHVTTDHYTENFAPTSPSIPYTAKSADRSSVSLDESANEGELKYEQDVPNVV